MNQPLNTSNWKSRDPMEVRHPKAKGALQLGFDSGVAVYDHTFHQGHTDGRAVIFDQSTDDEVLFVAAVIERSRFGGKAVVTFQERFRERCPKELQPERRFTRSALLKQARETIHHEFRFATDPFYPERPDREIY